MCEKISQNTNDYPVEEQNNETSTTAEINIEVNVNNESFINNTLEEEENTYAELQPVVFNDDGKFFFYLQIQLLK